MVKMFYGFDHSFHSLICVVSRISISFKENMVKLELIRKKLRYTLTKLEGKIYLSIPENIWKLALLQSIYGSLKTTFYLFTFAVYLCIVAAPCRRQKYKEYNFYQECYNSCLQNTVSPAGLEVPPLGPKWDRWAKKLGCASDPPIPADCRLEDRMRTRIFSPPYPTWALVGGDFKASRRNCIKSKF